MTHTEFTDKWRQVELKKRAAAQEHFLDLCRLLELPTPAEADPRGESFTFEKRVSKAAGGRGFADVWKRGHFAWEYKGRGKDLNAAYVQLLLYRDDVENPPLLTNANALNPKTPTRRPARRHPRTPRTLPTHL